MLSGDCLDTWLSAADISAPFYRRIFHRKIILNYWREMSIIVSCLWLQLAPCFLAAKECRSEEFGLRNSRELAIPSAPGSFLQRPMNQFSSINNRRQVSIRVLPDAWLLA